MTGNKQASNYFGAGNMTNFCMKPAEYGHFDYKIDYVVVVSEGSAVGCLREMRRQRLRTGVAFGRFPEARVDTARSVATRRGGPERRMATLSQVWAPLSHNINSLMRAR